MITNLLATITTVLVTNTTERLPTHWVNDPRPPGTEAIAVAIGHYEVDKDFDKKYIITTITEQTFVEMVLPDGTAVRILAKEKTKSQTEKLFYKRKQELWDEVPR